jgi:hypothetical protein
MSDISDEYDQKIYDWYDFEADCDDWCMDSCDFWDDIHLLFDDSTPPSIEHINVTHQEIFMITGVLLAYSTTILFPSRFSFDPFPLCGCIFLFRST